MKVIAIIPARRNSRRLQGKNWKLLLDKPLICYTVEEALKCPFINEILITTDSPEIVQICQQYSHDNRIQLIDRPKELATSEATSEDVITYALKEVHAYDWSTTVLLLQPTSPLRTSDDIEKAFRFYESCTRETTLVSVNKDTMQINGAIYIFQKDLKYPELMLIYKMSDEKSTDIDTLSDFEQAELRLIERELEKVNRKQEVVKK